MRVLMMHNRYLQKGGEDVSFKMESELLARHGFEVETHEEDNERVEKLGRLRTAARTVWSRESYDLVRKKLREKRFDILHVQNYFPLISPSVYHAAKAEGVGVVQTLRNYRLMCPPGTFSRDGKLCEACIGKSFAWPGVMHGCYRGKAATGVVAAMVGANHVWGTWRNTIDVYVALTHFMRSKFIEGGFPADKILVKPNFVHPDPGEGQGKGDYALFAGRLAEIKGVFTLLEAWKRLKTKVPLKILGTGPIEDEVRARAAQIEGVELLGWKPTEEIYELMGNARFIVLPSEWYEGFSRIIVEGFAKGTPVVAATIGSQTEAIDHGENGALFRVGDAGDLADKIDWLVSDPARLQAMRANARRAYVDKYSGDANMAAFRKVYETACASAAGRTAA